MHLVCIHHNICAKTFVMTAKHPQSISGFTLIEVMVTVAIIGILAAIALPSYEEYVKRGKMPEATAGLSQARIDMERWFQDNRKYDGTGNPCSSISNRDTKNFGFTCPTITATTYTIQATGKGNISSFSYTLNQANNKKSTTPWGGNTAKDCWIMRKGDTC
ncbi:MAG: type IV pilin protein [Pseudomonadota bacterium]|nr:type IV pilin protein [Pseudomonadota bacterium]